MATAQLIGRRTRFAGHCFRVKDDFISNILLMETMKMYEAEVY